jgi:hypothetical protein
MIDEQRADNIQEAADKFSSALEAMLGKGSEVYVAYVYCSPKREYWYSGDSGKMHSLARIGAAKFLYERAKDNLSPSND